MAAVQSALAPLCIEAAGTRVNRDGSYGGVRKCGPLELPHYMERALRDFYTGDYVSLESSSSFDDTPSAWEQQVQGWAQVEAKLPLALEVMPVHLFEAERHCNRIWIRPEKGPRTDLTRCREALLGLATESEDEEDAEDAANTEESNLSMLTVLRRCFGRRKPNLLWNDFPEVAPLVDLTPTVLTLARAREEARRAAARAELGIALREQAEREASRLASMKESWEKRRAVARERERGTRARLLHLERLAGALPLDTRAVLKEKLDEHLFRGPTESKRDFARRTLERNGARLEFKATVRAEAVALRTQALLAFRAAWWGSARSGGAA
ncbi:MAG TPA: hypothetical protein VGI39_04805 [Polyangiaceae bacterium]|jgi:hypothetical protein